MFDRETRAKYDALDEKARVVQEAKGFHPEAERGAVKAFRDEWHKQGFPRLDRDPRYDD